MLKRINNDGIIATWVLVWIFVGVTAAFCAASKYKHKIQGETTGNHGTLVNGVIK